MAGTQIRFRHFYISIGLVIFFYLLSSPFLSVSSSESFKLFFLEHTPKRASLYIRRNRKESRQYNSVTKLKTNKNRKERKEN
jgi:hypothetical protein